MPLRIQSLHPRFAAQITGFDLGQIADDRFAEIVAAWRQHPVLVFRDQTLSPEAQIAFARRLGDLDLAPPFDVEQSALAGYPELAVVSNIKVGGKPIGGLGDGELSWHSDMTYAETPPVACALLARELPPEGGDTYFLDLRAAWRELPQELRERVLSARIYHDRAYTSAGTPRNDAKASEGQWHPVRISDPVSGEHALMLGRRRNGRLAIGDDDDPELLDALWLHADQQAHVYRHRWRANDLVLWNNLMAMHRRDAFDPAARRLLHRAQIRRLNPAWQWSETQRT
jgi:taurine dioxygenase